MGIFSLKFPGKSNFKMKFVEVMNNVIPSLEVIQPTVRVGLQLLPGLRPENEIVLNENSIIQLKNYPVSPRGLPDVNHQFF